MFESIRADVMFFVCGELAIEGVDMVDVRFARFDGLFTDTAYVSFPGFVFAFMQALVFRCITLHLIQKGAFTIAQVSHTFSLGYGPLFVGK